MICDIQGAIESTKRVCGLEGDYADSVVEEALELLDRAVQAAVSRSRTSCRSEHVVKVAQSIVAELRRAGR